MDVKHPMLFFATNKRAIAGIMNKFLVGLTYSGHYNSGTAVPSANDATPQPCAAYESIIMRHSIFFTSTSPFHLPNTEALIKSMLCLELAMFLLAEDSWEQSMSAPM